MKYLSFPLLTVACVLAWFCSQTMAGDQKAYKVGAKGLEIDGQIDAEDPMVKVVFSNGFSVQAKLFNVTLSKGTKYRIAMTSKDIRSFILIQDSLGKQLAFDDAGGDYPDAQLIFTPDKDDTYKIYAAATKSSDYPKGVGKFKLRIGDDRSLAKEDGGLAVTAKTLKFEGRLDQFVKSVNYDVHLAEGKTYVIDMNSPFTEKLEPFLYLRDPAKSLVAQNDSAGKVNARIVYRAPSTGTYHVEASSYQGKGVGKFAVTIRELAKGIDASLTRGSFKVEGKLAKDDPVDELLYKSPCKVYSISLAKGKTYLIDLKSSDFDAFLRIEDSMGTQLTFDDDSGGGTNARIVLQPATDQEYRVIVTCVDQRTGDYTLAIHEK
jgi:hypothetical protein